MNKTKTNAYVKNVLCRYIVKSRMTYGCIKIIFRFHSLLIEYLAVYSKT